MKTGPSGALAQRFLTSKITPLLIGASLLAGVGGLLTTPREEEPQIRVPMIDVAAGLPGASPREVERRIAEPLERAIWEIPGIDYVYSASYPDGALVTARFKVGTDPETALTRLYGKLLAYAGSIPPGATPPLVTLHGIDEVPILTLTLSGGGDAGDGYLLRQQAAELAAELKRIPDVAELWVTGGAPREVTVTLDPQALAARGLSAAVVLQALGAANASAPAGMLVSAGRSVPVRVGHLLRDVDQVREVVVGVSGDRAVRLREVARVTDGPAEPLQYVGFLEGGGAGTFEPATTIVIAKRGGTNAATIGERVLHRVDEMRGRVLASDVRVTVTRNYGATASEKARELLFHILLATLGVVLLVWAALSWREAVVVLVAIPVTLALTLLVYRLYGYTLNRITLFALVFAIGILVDDAIVVVENIARHLGLKEREPAEAAVVAVDEVGNPTILATLTVIAAILPMAFVSGLMGPYMRPIPVGASVAMLFSLAVAFIVTPYLALRLVRSHAAPAGQAAGAPQAAEPRLARWYRRLLESLLGDRRRRWRAYGIVGALLLVSMALVPLKLVTVKMLPFDNKSEFQLIVDMPQGTTLERTAEVAQALALTVARDAAVRDVQTYAGVPAPFNFNGLVRHYFLRRGPTVADVQVNLVPKDERAASHAVALRLRPAVDSVARAYGAAVKVAEIPPGPPVQATLTAEIYGPDYAAQIAAAERVRDVFLRTGGVVDVDWSVAAPHAEVRAAVAQAEAARAGTNPRDVAQTIAAAMGGEGATVGLLHDDAAAEPVAIRLELPQASRGSVGDLAGLPVATARGARRLGSLARLDSAPAPQPIYHKNLRPVVYVTGDVAGKLESPVYAMLAMGDTLIRTAGGLPIHWAASPTLTERPLLVWDGEWRITYEVFRDLGIAFAAVLALIYLLVVAWFQSFKTPLVIMAPIPLTLVGILPAHALTGAFFTATSMIGMIALAGIIVRNSILLADFVELGLERGESLHDAVIASGLVRARPIVLTAAAVVIGGVVMVSDPIFQGLGIALIGGAVVATALTLVAVPLLYFEAHR
ncbi:MAG TPA: efflux RND transporter permease subunit [Gemmatimonadales bacterium]|nr:efflux RND transporter permease subunit [Gemmatimonadales bacterium]